MLTPFARIPHARTPTLQERSSLIKVLGLLRQSSTPLSHAHVEGGKVCADPYPCANVFCNPFSWYFIFGGYLFQAYQLGY